MSGLPPQIRIALLDDHDIVRYGTVAKLATERDFVIVGNYGTSREMITGLRVSPADVLVVDYSLSPFEVDGVSLIQALKSKFPDCSILIFSSHYDPATVALALRTGAKGFVGKNQDMNRLIQAIRTVASGGVHLDAEMSYRLAETTTANTESRDAQENNAEDRLFNGAKLSVKEREVIRCFLSGMTVSQIAEKFNRSVKTISTQKSMAFRKLAVTSDNELFKIRSMLDGL